eukprot:jgi/Galph1/2804/GphlegSOOS_G1485.1
MQINSENIETQRPKREEKPTPPLELADDDALTAVQHMTAGALAGIAEHSVMYPVDTIKTRMQTYMAALDLRRSITSAVRSIIVEEGVTRLWRGIGAVVLSAGPAHAVYFATYEAAKRAFGGNRFRYTTTLPLATAAAGGIATVVADGIMSPFDVVKQRMQLKGSTYKSIFDCVSSVYKQHGWMAFFVVFSGNPKGYKTTLIMNVPFTAIHFTCYESCKKLIHKWRNVGSDELSIISHLVAGAVAGGVASACTNPFDVVKTRLQTQGERKQKGARRYKNMTSAMKSIYYEEGLKGFLHGIRPRVLFHMPAAAICFTVYASCKHILRTKDEHLEHTA